MNRKTKRLVLDTNHLAAMLTDPGFYDVCVAFEYLRPTAMETAKEYHASGEDCGGCGGNAKILIGLIEAFSMKMVNSQTQPEIIDQVRQYLAPKKRYWPKPLVLFYRTRVQSRPKRYEF